MIEATQLVCEKMEHMRQTSDSSEQTKLPIVLVSLKQRPELRKETLDLIGRVFPKGSPTSKNLRPDFEFPLLLDPDHPEQTIVAYDEVQKRVIATASFRSFEFTAAHGKTFQPLRIAGIGLVVTHPDFQRQGLGHMVHQSVETHARKAGCHLSILWSELVTYYTGLGYMPAGTEYQWQLDQQDLTPLRRRLDQLSQAIKVRAISNFHDIEKIYQAKRIGPKRPHDAYQRLLGLPNTYAYGARNQHDELIAYAFMGKGRDLRDTIHEIQGDPLGVAPLLNAMLPHCESGLRVYHAPDSDLLPELENFLGRSSKNAMAFFKVIALADFVTWLNESQLLPSGIRVVLTPKGFSLSSKVLTFFESNDPAHLIQLFFGPWTVNELEDLPTALQTNLSGLQRPISPYFWGFDSV